MIAVKRRGRRLRRFLALLPLGLLGLALARPTYAGVLDVPLIGQRGGFWCWAASSEMVLDYLAPSPIYEEAVGQCTLVRSVPRPPCDCQGADGFNVTDDDCRLLNPFGSEDFVPLLLPGVQKTHPRRGHRVPLHRDLLACEIDRRERPVVVWWRDGRCEDAGHLAVASGIEPDTARGDLVLMRDPWPVEAGNVYWLTWRGFSCGFRLQGHCVDYFDVQGAAAPPSCEPAPVLDDLECGESAPAEHEWIYALSQAETAISELLESDAGSTLRKGLGVREGVRRLECNERVVIRGARLGLTESGSVSLVRIGTTRLLCELEGETSRTPASVFLIDRDGEGWLLAGFGAARTTEWLGRAAEPLILGLDREAEAIGEPRAEPVELYEVEVPGTGDILLVRSGPEGRSPTVRYQAPPEILPRSLQEVLEEPVAGPGSPTLGSWIRSLPADE